MKMNKNYLWLLCCSGVLLAGCSSAPVAQNAANGSAAPQAAPQYHHEVISEFSDGETKFLHLTPSNDP